MNPCQFADEILFTPIYIRIELLLFWIQINLTLRK